MSEKRKSLLYGVVCDILGKPRKKNEHRQQYSFDCPTCSAEKGLYDGDGKGNLEVNLIKGVYHCWACGGINNTHGSIKKLIRTFGNKQQIKKLKLLGIDVNEIKTKKITSNVIEDLTLPESYISFENGNKKNLQYKQAWNYLVKQRKLTEDIIYKHRLGYTTSGKYADRIIVPSYDVNGKLDYWVGRTYIGQKPKYYNPDSDKEVVIFNEGLIDWDSSIYLVEGPFDHIVVHNSIPMLGKDISDKLMSNLFNKTTSDIIVLLDADGWKDAKELYSKLNIGKLYGRVKIIKLEEDYDIAKIHEDFGREGVIKTMKKGFILKESLI